MELDTVRKSVREHYGKIATRSGGCGCAPACCSTAEEATANERNAAVISRELGYTPEETATVPEGANLGLGCGNPLAIASLKPGQTVLDLGSGAGFDAFLAAKAVGPTDLVIDVDMTAEIVSKARQNKTKGGYANVDFRLGEIESLPVAEASGLTPDAIPNAIHLRSDAEGLVRSQNAPMFGVWRLQFNSGRSNKRQVFAKLRGVSKRGRDEV